MRGQSHSSVSTHAPWASFWWLSGRHCAHSRSTRRKQPKPKASTQQWLSRQPSKCGDGVSWQCGRHGGGAGGGAGGAGAGRGGGGGASHVDGQSHSAVSTHSPWALLACLVNGRHMANAFEGRRKHANRCASRQQRLSKQEEKCSDGAAWHRWYACCTAAGGVPGNGGGEGGGSGAGGGGGWSHVRGQSHCSVSTHSPVAASCWWASGRHKATSLSGRRKQPKPCASMQHLLTAQLAKCAAGLLEQRACHGPGATAGSVLGATPSSGGGEGAVDDASGGGGDVDDASGGSGDGRIHVCGHNHSLESTQTPCSFIWWLSGRHCANARSARWKQPKPNASTQQ